MTMSDLDEVFTSATLPLSALEKQVKQETVDIATRLALAEQVLFVLTEAIGKGYPTSDDDLLVELALWEKARGKRFIFTDTCEHVIATGRGGLNNYFNESGIDTDQENWELVAPETVIPIWCDSDGVPDEVQGEGCAIVKKTAAEWLEQIKEDGSLCSTDH